MLGDEDAAVIDELGRALLLGGLVIPGAREGDFHGDRRADGLGAKVERGVAGDDLCVCVGAHVAHLCLVGGDLSGVDHLVELHAGGNARKIAALVDGCKGVVIVVKALGVRLGTGGVAELDIRELLGGVDEVEVIRGVLVVQRDEARLDGCSARGAVARAGVGAGGALPPLAQPARRRATALPPPSLTN